MQVLCFLPINGIRFCPFCQWQTTSFWHLKHGIDSWSSVIRAGTIAQFTFATTDTKKSLFYMVVLNKTVDDWLKRACMTP